ncbi:MAG: helix-turn-helix domain-containing protein [Clostridiales bacterium]|nr:helix-turn-helix domain-containing protein [Clostridiales bacterium]
MKKQLSDNIRAFRKQKGLTQQQLADVFGVTVGAVHKWEAGLSTPDLTLIFEMADFFDVSLDVLTGYEVRDNRIDALAARLRKMAYSMDPEGLSEAEKALKKYPNYFSIVFECALLYGVYGINPVNNDYLMRSVSLFERAVSLISQNTDPDIDETVIYGQLAVLHQTMGNTEKALQIYKAHNAGGVYDIRIGHIMSARGDYKGADECLSRSLVKQLGDRMTLIMGKLNCYLKLNDYPEAKALIDAALSENASYRRADEPYALDKFDCVLLTEKAYAELKSGNKRQASECLKQAKRRADLIDKAPDHDAGHLRFVSLSGSLVLHDSFGKTCLESIELILASLKDKELNKFWASVKEKTII